MELHYSKTKRLAISKIFPGMITARDVYTRYNQLIIHKGMILDSDKIQKLIFYTIESVFVYEKPEIDELEPDIYSERIRESIEFRQFVKQYDNAVVSVRNWMNDILNNTKEIDADALLQDVNKILYESKNKSHLLNMLHCIRSYDDLTFMHSVNVALICNIFSEWLNFNKEDKEILTISGLLHDIGKILLPIHILNKPDKLTSEEYELMKQHTLRGYEILLDKNIDERIKKVALLHHERYDGSGYTNNLKGEEIDIFSTIVSIADVYDAMTSSRIYRGSFCPFDVIRLFEKEGCLQYNPKVLIPLLERITASYMDHTVRLSNGVQGVISLLNRDALSRPVIKISDHELLDLSRNFNIRIEEVL